jgi:hypothetical protein
VTTILHLPSGYEPQDLLRAIDHNEAEREDCEIDKHFDKHSLGAKEVRKVAAGNTGLLRVAPSISAAKIMHRTSLLRQTSKG